LRATLEFLLARLDVYEPKLAIIRVLQDQRVVLQVELVTVESENVLVLHVLQAVGAKLVRCVGVYQTKHVVI
jgi:hypothetical protein